MSQRRNNLIAKLFALSLSAIFLLPQAVLAKDSTTYANSVDESLDKAASAELHGEFSHAAAYYRKALHDSEQYGEHDLKRANVLYLAAQFYNIKCDYDNAIKCALEADDIYEFLFREKLSAEPPPDEPSLSWQKREPALAIWLLSLRNLERLTNFYCARGQKNKAVSLLNEKLNFMRSHAAIGPLLKAESETIYQDWLEQVNRYTR